MDKIRLSPRLKKVADLVRIGVSVADIGTDHGYLPAYLVQNGKVRFAIASDLRQGPLERAMETVDQCELNDKIQLRISDGLQSISCDEVDDVVIAGMGGELISQILKNCPWSKNKEKHFVLQPMTHSDELREYLCDNGFEIINDIVVREGKKLYNVIETVFTNTQTKQSEVFKYIGKISDFSNEDNHAYLEKMIAYLKMRLIGLDNDIKFINEIKELEKLL